MAKITLVGGDRFRPGQTGIPRAGQVGRIFGAEGRGAEALSNVITGITKEAIDKRDRAVDVDYIANSNVKAQAQIQGLRENMLTNREDPQGFSQEFITEANKVYDGLVADAPSEQSRQSLKTLFSGQKVSQFKQAFDLENKAIADGILSNTQESINISALNVFENPKDLKEILKSTKLSLEASSEVLSTSEQTKLVKQAEKEIIDSAIKGFLVSDIKAAEELVNSDSLKGLLTSDQIQSYRNAVEERKIRDTNKAAKELNTAQEGLVLDRQLGIFRDEVTQLELDSDLEKGLYGIKEYLSLSGKLDSKLKGETAVSNTILKVADQQELGVPFDTANPKVKKELDVYFDSVVIPSLTKENREDKVASFIDKFQYIPASAKSGMMAALHNGSKGEIGSSSRLISSLVKKDPQLARQFTNSDLLRAATISQSVFAGMPLEDAITASDNMLVEKNTTQWKERQKMFNSDKDEIDQDDFQRFFRNDPADLPEGMVNEWNTLYKNYAVNNKVDFDTARDLATKIVNSKWGVSNATGDEKYMKHAPENYYNKRGLDPKWIEKQLQVDVNSISAEIKDYDLSVHPDTETTNNPGYLVNYISPNGIPLLLRDEEGALLVWRPDITTSEDANNQIKEKEDKLKSKRTFLKEFGTPPEITPELIKGDK